MTTRESLLAEIAELKATKPENWKRKVHAVCTKLYYLDHPNMGPMPQHFHGDAYHQRLGRCPQFDSMHDRSFP